MRRTWHAAHDGRGTLPRRTILAPVVLLGAVLYGCAFFVPAIGTAAGITVEIIKPTTAPRYSFETAKEYDFEAVAFVEGQELPGGEVSWQWNFGDGTDPVLVNPTKHTFARTGNWTVTVTATYGQLSGQATLNAAAAGGGLLDKVEFLVVPDTGGRVCDQVEVMLRIPEHELSIHNAFLGPVRIYRWDRVYWLQEVYTMGQSYRLMGDTSYRTVSTWWTTPGDPNTAAVNWCVEYTLWVLEPPPEGEEAPYYATVTDTKNGSWTPYNLVITAGGPLIIEHHKGDSSHTLSWQAAHLEDDEAAIPKTYTATVQVLDMSGNVVASSPSLVRTINQNASWDWAPSFPPEGDADGLYAFRITGEHTPEDVDTDKVDMLTGVDNASESDKMHIDWDTLTLRGKIKYTAAGELASPVLHIYGPSAAQISLPTEAGYHEIPYDLPIGYGTFYAVITATQTAAQAANNRDGVDKPVIPEGCYLGSIPGPPQAVEICEPHHPPASNFHFCFSPQNIGECQVSATGRVKDFEYMNLALRWQMDGIGGTELRITPESARGSTIQFLYRWLPASNSEFGPKTVTLTHPLVSSPDTCTVKIFFCPGAFNHPTEDPPVPLIPTPNW